MRRRYLHAAGAKLGFNIVVGYNRDTSSYDWQNDFLADQVFEPFIVRMHSNRTVAEHRLGSCGCDDEMPFT